MSSWLQIHQGAEKMATLNDLTPRELEILQLVIAGKSNKEIARAFFISRKTVEFHLDHIYSKLGMRTRVMAGIWAIQHGLQAETGVNPS